MIELTPAKKEENLFGFGRGSFSMKDFHKHQIQHNALQSHPGEWHQEEIVKSYGDAFTHQLG